MVIAVPLADLALIASALVALILTYALVMLFRPLLNFIGKSIPLVGARAAAWGDNILNQMQQTSQQWWHSAVTPLISLVYSFPKKLDSWMQGAEQIFQHISYQLHHLPQNIGNATGLTSLINQVKAYGSDIADLKQQIANLEARPKVTMSDVENVAKGLIAGAVGTLDQEVQHGITQAETWAKQETNNAVMVGTAAQQAVNRLAVQVGTIAGTVNRLVSQLGGVSESAISQELYQVLRSAENYTNQQEQALQGDLVASLNQAEQAAAQMVSALSGTLNSSIASVDSAIGNVTGRLEKEIQSAENTAKKYADSEVGKVALEVGASAATLAAVEALTRSTTQVVSNYLDKCGMPLCENVRPQIPWLKDLNSVISDGLILELLAEAIGNPGGTAEAFAGMITPFANTAGALISDLLPKA